MPVREWLILRLLLTVPLVNVVLLFILAFSRSCPISKRNYCKASLIYLGIVGVLAFVACFILSLGAISLMGSKARPKLDAHVEEVPTAHYAVLEPPKAIDEELKTYIGSYIVSSKVTDDELIAISKKIIKESPPVYVLYLFFYSSIDDEKSFIAKVNWMPNFDRDILPLGDYREHKLSLTRSVSEFKSKKAEQGAAANP